MGSHFDIYRAINEDLKKLTFKANIQKDCQT